MWRMCVLLGFRVFVGWYLVLVLMIVFVFGLCIARCFMCLMVVRLDKVCVIFLGYLGVEKEVCVVYSGIFLLHYGGIDVYLIYWNDICIS